MVLSPGPSSTATSCAAASSPMARPISSPSAGSQLQATVAAVGKQVAGTLGFRPRWSAVPACLRTPFGPSDRVMDGTPALGQPRVVKVPAPESSAHFCSRFSFAMISAFFKGDALLFYKAIPRNFKSRSCTCIVRYCGGYFYAFLFSALAALAALYSLTSRTMPRIASANSATATRSIRATR